MKIVIIGGSGLIGKKLGALLSQAGHEVIAASPSSGVNAVTGEGLAQVLAGAEVVVDVTNSPSFEDEAVMEFFKASNQNLLAAELVAHVRHHVALSVVGSERLPTSGYFRAKLAQESIIKNAGVPYTILRATQFFEFLSAIAQASTDHQTVRASSALLQPIAADDVAAALAKAATERALNGTCEVAGPQSFRLDDLLRRILKAGKDLRNVVRDDDALYFGTRLTDESLRPVVGARTGTMTLEAWLARRAA